MTALACCVRAAVLGALANLSFRAAEADAAEADAASADVHRYYSTLRDANLLHCHARIAAREVSL